MAKARRNLLLNFQFPLKGLNVATARQQQPPLTSPDLVNVLPIDLDRRFRGAKRPGFSVLTGGSIGSVAATYRQAQKCSDNLVAGLYIPTVDISSYPYVFSYSGVCYYVSEETVTTENPPGTVPSSGSRVTYATCAACATAVSPPPSPPATYVQLRRCSDDGLAPFWIATSGLSYPTHFLRGSDDICYYADSADDPTTTTPGTLIGTNATKADCATCETDRGGGGTDRFYRAKKCSDDTYVDVWLHEDDLGDDPTPVNNLPLYFYANDIPGEVLYILAVEPDVDDPDRVYDRETETTPAGSCTTLGGCYEDSMPATGSLTITGATMNPDCTETTDGTGSWKTTGTINGTFTLNKISQSSTRVVYTASLATGDPRMIQYYCGAIGLTNTTCGAAVHPDCSPVISTLTPFYATLEIDTSVGTPTGWRLTIDLGDQDEGPRMFRGELTNVSSCRGSKVIPNSITARELSNAGSTSTSESAASGGSAVITLNFT